MSTTINAKARLQADAAMANVKRVLQRIAYTVAPSYAIARNPALKLNGGQNNATCHGAVAEGIHKRGNPADLIWIFGNGPDVTHSVLTNEDHQVVVDTFKKVGKFMGANGYKYDDDQYDLLDVIPVSELYDEYMEYPVMAANEADKAQKESEKARKEAVDRQIENNKRQQEQIHNTMPSNGNKTSVSPVQKLDKQKQINRLKDQALDLRKQKLEN
jgi:hypothetical protein